MPISWRSHVNQKYKQNFSAMLCTGDPIIISGHILVMCC